MKLPLAVGVVTLAIAAVCEGRPVRAWTYEDLVGESHVVVIATAVESRDVDPNAVIPNMARAGPDGQRLPYAAVGVETRFEVQAVLKGEVKAPKDAKDAKDSAKTLVVYHFREAPAQQPAPNGPMLVTFNTDGRHRYLLFLHRSADGRFTSATGQTDPATGVKDLGTHP